MDASVVRRPPFGANPLVGERGTDTRRRILGAALAVFAEVGYAESRVELVTARAGCSRPAFYQYFSGKDDVFWALARQLGHEMVGLAEGLGHVAPDRAGVDHLSGWIGRFMALHEAWAPIFASFQAASRGHESRAEVSGGFAGQIAGALLRGFDVHGTDADATLVNSLLSVLIRCSDYAGMAPPGTSTQPLVEGLALFVHRVFVGPVEGVNVVRTRAGGRDGRGATARGTRADGRAGGREVSGHTGTDGARVPGTPTGLGPPVGALGPTGLGPDAGASARHPRGEQTRVRLLDAGATVLPARGYHDTRVDDLVAAAGVSHGTFYRYFDNKDDFFRVLAHAAASRMLDQIDRLPVDAPAGELRAWLRSWLAAYRADGGVIGTWQEMRTNRELRAFSQGVAASVLDRLVRLLGGRDFGDPVVDATILLALVERVPYGVYTLGIATEEEALDTMLVAIRRGILALT